MFDIFHHVDNFDTARPSPLHDLRAFVDKHHTAMLDAAALLGGTRGVRLAQSIFDGLTEDGAPTRRVLRALDDLIDLLMLEHVHDPEREEATRFAQIDPASPCVEDICFLADGLKDVLDAYRGSEADRSGTQLGGAAA